MKIRLGQWSVAIALAAICIALSIARESFLTLPNLINLIRQISINGILAVGVTHVLLTGGVDLSLGSVVALAGVAAASFAHPGELPLIAPVAIGILTGALCGAANGIVITRGRVAPFIVTLGMMTAARGLALVASGGKPVSNLSRGFTRAGSGDLLGIPYPALIFFAVAAIGWVFLSRTRWGVVGNFDWRPDEATKVFVRAFYANYRDSETRDQFRIELCACGGFEFRQRCVHGHRRAPRARSDHAVVGIGHGAQARTDRNARPLDARRIPAAVPMRVVVLRDVLGQAPARMPGN